jgi:DNA-binding transcriptional MocR family regulator
MGKTVRQHDEQGSPKITATKSGAAHESAVSSTTHDQFNPTSRCVSSRKEPNISSCLPQTEPAAVELLQIRGTALSRDQSAKHEPAAKAAISEPSQNVTPRSKLKAAPAPLSPASPAKSAPRGGTVPTSYLQHQRYVSLQTAPDRVPVLSPFEFY